MVAQDEAPIDNTADRRATDAQKLDITLEDRETLTYAVAAASSSPWKHGAEGQGVTASA